jgi:hypothetical protein
MIGDRGDKKMASGEMATGSNARTAHQQGNAKARLSPELQELMHMLSSLEHQLTRENENE